MLRVGVVVRPAFKTAKQKFNPQQVECSRIVASVRIYVEQAIKRIKSYRGLDNLSFSELKFCSLNFQNAALATNFQNGFVSAANPHKTDDKLQTLYNKFCEAVECSEQSGVDTSVNKLNEMLTQTLDTDILSVLPGTSAN